MGPTVCMEDSEGLIRWVRGIGQSTFKHTLCLPGTILGPGANAFGKAIQERGCSHSLGEQLPLPCASTHPSLAHRTITGRGALSGRTTALDLGKTGHNFLTARGSGSWAQHKSGIKIMPNQLLCKAFEYIISHPY